MTTEQDIPSTVTIDPQKVDLAIKRYDSILRYYQTENQLMWTRSQHFLVAHAALLGFTTAKLPALHTEQPMEYFVLLTVLFIVGILLSILWRRAIISGEFWTDHCRGVLRDLEHFALGDTVFVREFISNRRFVSGKLTIKYTAWLFTILWLFVGTYISIVSYQLYASSHA